MCMRKKGIIRCLPADKAGPPDSASKLKMRFQALATDYDGTLAHDGVVADSTNAALKRLAASGRKLILVTGRHLPDLKRVYSRLDLFDRVVAENGALLYDPKTQKEKLLCQPPPERLLSALKRNGVKAVVGRAIVATWLPFHAAVLEAIREAKVDYQAILNKDAVMLLPKGVDKATGIGTALAELKIDAQNVVAVGDAENDEVFLSACACGVAVANALPTLKRQAGVVMTRDHGAGVEELADHLLNDSLDCLNRVEGFRSNAPAAEESA